MISRGEKMDGLAPQLCDQFDRRLIDRTFPGPSGGDPATAFSPVGSPTKHFQRSPNNLASNWWPGRGRLKLLVIDHVEKTLAKN